MTNDELQKYVEVLSLRHFNKPFIHKVYWNNRLKTTGGRYHLKSHHIDINPKVLEKLGMEALDGVIKHELCHYHLHLNGLGYKHQDIAFKQLLKQVGGMRYVQWQYDITMYKWIYRCQKCGIVYKRKRQINTKKYVCSTCRGYLQLYKSFEK